MALPIRDGNQSLTTLSTILVSNAHIPAHTVVSLGTQAITDIATAVSGVELGPNTLNALENITVTLGQVTITGGLTDAQLRASAVTIAGVVTANLAPQANGPIIEIDSPMQDDPKYMAIVGGVYAGGEYRAIQLGGSGEIIVGSIPAISGTVTLGASTSQIGSVTASISNSLTIGSLPAISGAVTASISGTPSVTFGTAVITGSTSILNFPATQTVTFSQAPVTFGLIFGTVTANPTGTQTIAGEVTANLTINAFTNTQAGIASDDGGGEPNLGIQLGYYDGDYKTVKPSQPLPISGTVTASLFDVTDPVQDNGTSGKTVAIKIYDSSGNANGQISASPVFVGGTVTIGSALPAGTNRIGVVTIGGGTVTIGAGTAQIGSVTASISGTVPVSISSVTVGNSVTIGSLPSISGTVTANVPNIQVCTSGIVAQTSAIQTALGVIDYNNSSQVLAVFGQEAVEGDGTAVFVQVRNQISGTVTANTFAVQGTSVTTSNFTSTTASTVLAGFNATREVLTIFNEGAGNLHICAGATCTTIAYQVRLSAGDYYEVPNHQTTITHSAVFATAGTARVTQIS